MSFAPVMGPGSHTHLYLQSSVHACFASLAALCSSLLASIYALVDNLAARMPSAYCPVCRYNARRATKPTENTSAEDKITAVVFDPGTGFCTLKRLEDIDVEKAIFRDFLPSSVQSIKVQLSSGETKSLAEVVDDPCWRKGLKHKRSLVDGFYILPGRAGSQTTLVSSDTHEDKLVELPAPGFFKQKKHPVELPADEVSPVPNQPIIQPASPTPLLLTPRPRSKTTRKASPLLAPPPRDGFSEKRSSYGSSVGSASIQIAYQPSPREDGEREDSERFKVSTSIPEPASPVAMRRFLREVENAG